MADQKHIRDKFVSIDTIRDNFCSMFGDPIFFNRYVEFTKENRMVLSNAAQRMRNNPGVKIELSGCWHTIAQKKSMEELRNALHNYFDQKEGISYDRFVLGTHLCRVVKEHIKIACHEE